MSPEAFCAASRGHGLQRPHRPEVNGRKQRFNRRKNVRNASSTPASLRLLCIALASDYREFTPIGSLVDIVRSRYYDLHVLSVMMTLSPSAQTGATL